MVSTNELYGLEKQKGPTSQPLENLFASRAHSEVYLAADGVIPQGDKALAGFLNGKPPAPESYRLKGEGEGYSVNPGDNFFVYETNGKNKKTLIDFGLADSPYSDAGIAAADQVIRRA